MFSLKWRFKHCRRFDLNRYLIVIVIGIVSGDSISHLVGRGQRQQGKYGHFEGGNELQTDSGFHRQS